MKTIVKQENIFKYLESLRKLNIKAYVLQWGINQGEDFVLIHLPCGKLDKKEFTVQVESLGGRSKREKEEIYKASVSNVLFRKEIKGLTYGK